MVVRLHEAIAAVCPIVSVRGSGPGNAGYDAKPEATAPQLAAANAALAAFDWSPAAHEAWLAAQEPELRTLLDQAATGIGNIDDYLAIAATATNAQVRAEVEAIDRRQRRIILALARTIVRTWRA